MHFSGGSALGVYFMRYLPYLPYLVLIVRMPATDLPFQRSSNRREWVLGRCDDDDDGDDLARGSTFYIRRSGLTWLAEFKFCCISARGGQYESNNRKPACHTEVSASQAFPLRHNLLRALCRSLSQQSDLSFRIEVLQSFNDALAHGLLALAHPHTRIIVPSKWYGK